MFPRNPISSDKTSSFSDKGAGTRTDWFSLCTGPGGERTRANSQHLVPGPPFSPRGERRAAFKDKNSYWLCSEAWRQRPENLVLLQLSLFFHPCLHFCLFSVSSVSHLHIKPNCPHFLQKLVGLSLISVHLCPIGCLISHITIRQILFKMSTQKWVPEWTEPQLCILGRMGRRGDQGY